MIIIGIVLIVLGLLVLAGGLWLHHLQGQIMDGPGMVYEPDIESLTYYHGGSSIGDIYRIDLYESSFTVTECPGNGNPTSEKKYDVGAGIYGKLEEIVFRYDMTSWTDLPDSDVIALDGPTTYIDICFADGREISASSNQELPKGGWNAVDEIRAAFESEME